MAGNVGVSFFGLYLSLGLFALSGLILLSGEIRSGNLVLWDAEGRLAPTYNKRRVSNIEAQVQGIRTCEETSMSHKSSLEQIQMPTKIQPQSEHVATKASIDIVGQDKSDQDKHDLLVEEGNNPQKILNELRFDLTSVPVNMAPSVAIVIYRAIVDAQEANANEDQSNARNHPLEDINPMYVPNTAQAMELSRASLLTPSRTENSSAMLLAIRSRRLPAILSIIEEKDFQAEAWDLWAMAYRWPLLTGVRSLSTHRVRDHLVNIERNDEEINNEEQMDNTIQQQKRSEHVFVINTDDIPDSGRPIVVQDLHTIDFLLDSSSHTMTSNTSYLHFFVCENFRVFDSLIMQAVPEVLGVSYPHGLDLNISTGQHNPHWWRSFQFLPPAAVIIESVLNTTKNSNTTAEDHVAAMAEETRRTLQEPPLPEMWMISPGAALQARYSEGHTVRLQLTGTVRYTLFSSSILHQMYLHPSYSGKARQSQVPMYRYDHVPDILAEINAAISSEDEAINRTRQSKSSSDYFNFFNAILKCEHNGEKIRGKSAAEVTVAGCMRFATLTPGQMLYIPPYWSVHAEALDANATVKILQKDVFSQNQGVEHETQKTSTQVTQPEIDRKVLAMENSQTDSSQRRATPTQPPGGGVAVAVDIYSPSETQLVLGEAWHMRIPIVDAFQSANSNDNFTISPAERIIATQVYAVHVLSRLRTKVDGETSKSRSAALKRINKFLSSPKTFSSRLYKSRYESRYPQHSLFMQQQLKDFTCYRIRTSSATSINGTDGTIGSESMNEEIVNKVLRKLDRRLIESRAQFIADCFLDPSLDTEPAAVRLTWIENYIERLAYWAMGGEGDVYRAGLFVLQCLDQKDMLNVVEEVEGPPVIRLSGGAE